MLCNRDSQHFGLFFVFFPNVTASSLSFMDTCSFELENICGMIQSSDDNSDWQRLSQVPAGPSTDHTNMGECKGRRKNCSYLSGNYFPQRHVNWLRSWSCWQITVYFLTKHHKSTYFGKVICSIFCLFEKIECPISFHLFSSLSVTSWHKKCVKLSNLWYRHTRKTAAVLSNRWVRRWKGLAFRN